MRVHVCARTCIRVEKSGSGEMPSLRPIGEMPALFGLIMTVSNTCYFHVC